MKIKSALLIIALVVLSSCEIIDYLQGIRTAKRINLISDDYVKCMHSELPCECAKKFNGYYEMKLDSHLNDDDSNVFYAKANDENEYQTLNFSRVNKNTLRVYRSTGDSTYAVGNLSINRRKAYLVSPNGETLNYTLYSTETEHDDLIIGRENLRLLNEAFKSRKIKPFETNAFPEWVGCDCNHELGNINLMWVDRSPASWILEHRNDSLFIYEYVNSSDGRKIPATIAKRLVKSYPWK